MTRLLASPLTALLDASRSLFSARSKRHGCVVPTTPIDQLSAHELRDIGIDAEAPLFQSWQRY